MYFLVVSKLLPRKHLEWITVFVVIFNSVVHLIIFHNFLLVCTDITFFEYYQIRRFRRWFFCVQRDNYT